MSKAVSYVVKSIEKDVEIATRVRVPILITGAPGRALAIAQRIAGHRGVAGAVVVCDAVAAYDMVAAVTADTGTSDGWCDEPPTMVLRDVDMLSGSQQEAMMKALDSRSSRSDDQMSRIIATASVSLIDRVKQGAFDERLFYRLNVIHIVVPPDAEDAR